MITILADPHGYRATPPNALQVHGPGDYVGIRIAIRRACNLGEPLIVHIKDRLTLHWFEDLIHYTQVYWEQVAPEEDYRRLFGAEPALPFTAELLVDLDIANLHAPPPDSAVIPAGWVLGERLHPVWGTPQPGSAHLAQLIGWAIKHAVGVRPALIPLMNACLTTWSAADPAYRALRAGSLQTDAVNLIRRSALQRYDPAWLRELGLADLPLITPTVDQALWVAALNDLAPTISHYWRERATGRVLDHAFVHDAVMTMSGWIATELHFVVSMLTRNAHMLNLPLISALRQRFTHMPEAAVMLDELAALVPPPLPAIPADSWSDLQWLRWATDDYMPYFAWVIRTQQPREHQEACAYAYEAWLARRYPDWLVRADTPLITSQFTFMRDLLAAQPTAVVVWLVIDGLTWWQGQIFQEICRHHRLFPQRVEAGVAILPSLTDVSKRALVTGMATDAPPQGSIAQAAQAKLDQSGVRGYVGYDGRDIWEALGAAEPPQCLIWFANTLDRLAHDRVTFADDRVVRGYLEELAQALGRMRVACVERGHPFHVLVGSDHGSTLLNAHSVTRRIPQAAHEVVDVWEDRENLPAIDRVSARAVKVSDPVRLQIDKPDEWHHLTQVTYQLPSDYLVPRGYAAVGRRPSGWTHGGLTPEETVVPCLHLAPEPLVIQALKLTVNGRIQPRMAGALTITLVNPNPAPLDDLVIQIADAMALRVARVGAGEQHTGEITLPARSVEGSDLLLSWGLEGRFLGVEHRQQGEVRMLVRRLQTESGFDDLFR